jgi:hypothetical protein
LLASARPGDGLEHVFARSAGNRVGAVLFLVASTPELAATTAVLIYQRAADAMPTRYRLLSCAVAQRLRFAPPTFSSEPV